MPQQHQSQVPNLFLRQSMYPEEGQTHGSLPISTKYKYNICSNKYF